jgi:hypothetical protein
LLPPPIAPHLPSQQLLSAQLYQTYVNHLTSLSLNENVHLLLVAPVLSNAQPANAKPVGTWWTDEGEIERVIRMYGEFQVAGPCLDQRLMEALPFTQSPPLLNALVHIESFSEQPILS